MKKSNWLAILTGAMAACAISQAANATAVSFTQDQVTIPGDTIVAPNSTFGNFVLSTMGSVPGIQKSPYGDTTSTYSCLNCGGGGTSDAVYDIALGTTGISLFWGSPDTYNTLEFFGNGQATPLFSITGAGLNPPLSDGHNLVSFSFNGNNVTSMELIDNEQAAFEYSDITATPLPAALPLFAGGLGILGLLSRRRKRQAAGALPA